MQGRRPHGIPLIQGGRQGGRLGGGEGESVQHRAQRVGVARPRRGMQGGGRGVRLGGLGGGVAEEDGGAVGRHGQSV